MPPPSGVASDCGSGLSSFLLSVPAIRPMFLQAWIILVVGIWRQRRALRGVYGCQTFGRLAPGGFEVANAQPGQGGLYPVHNARTLPHQAFALPVRPLGVLFGNRWHARHAAMAPFSTQPPQEPALQQLGAEPAGLPPRLFPGNGPTRGRD